MAEYNWVIPQFKKSNAELKKTSFQPEKPSI